VKEVIMPPLSFSTLLEGTSRDLGIGSGQIYRWRKQFSEDGARTFPGNGKSRDEELAALRKENKELREERDILRKATAIFSRPPR
jgi:transposase